MRRSLSHLYVNLANSRIPVLIAHNVLDECKRPRLDHGRGHFNLCLGRASRLFGNDGRNMAHWGSPNFKYIVACHSARRTETRLPRPSNTFSSRPSVTTFRTGGGPPQPLPMAPRAIGRASAAFVRRYASCSTFRHPSASFALSIRLRASEIATRSPLR